MPDNFLLPGGGILDFVSAAFGVFNTVTYPALPLGRDSYDAQQDLTGLNTPRNFAGSVGQVPEPDAIALAALAPLGALPLVRRLGRGR